MKNVFGILLTVTTLASCGGGSSDGSSASGAKVRHTSTFSDSAVSSFVQSGGIAKANTERLMNLVVSSAYAASGEISCVVGDEATFDVMALGESVNFTVPCSTGIDLSIRQELLEVLKNKTFLIEYDDGGLAARTVNVTIPNTSDRQFVVSVENAQAGKAGCYDNMTFDMDTGIMSFTNDQAKSVTEGCSVNEYTNSANAYTAQMVFRFQDGKLELDFNLNSPKFTVGDEDFVRWCLDEDTDGNCDA